MKKRQLDSPDKLGKFANEQRYLRHKTWEDWLHQTLTTDSRGYSGVCGVVCATRMQRLCVRVNAAEMQKNHWATRQNLFSLQSESAMTSVIRHSLGFRDGMSDEESCNIKEKTYETTAWPTLADVQRSANVRKGQLSFEYQSAEDAEH